MNEENEVGQLGTSLIRRPNFEFSPTSSLMSMSDFSESPLTALAKVEPEKAYDIMKEILEFQRRAQDIGLKIARINAMTSVLHSEANTACTWLQNRRMGEKNIDIDFNSSSGSSGWFSSLEGIRASLSVRIS